MPIKPSTSQACNVQTCTECKYEQGSMVVVIPNGYVFPPYAPTASAIWYLWNGEMVAKSIDNDYYGHYTINNCYRSGSWCYYTGKPMGNGIYEICRRT